MLVKILNWVYQGGFLVKILLGIPGGVRSLGPRRDLLLTCPGRMTTVVWGPPPFPSPEVASLGMGFGPMILSISPQGDAVVYRIALRV